MKETDWAKHMATLLQQRISNKNGNLFVEAGKKLSYANEIICYEEGGEKSKTMVYETDILVYEKCEDKCWKPRVVLETKINSVTTHDAITYSQKSAAHKFVHPYLRYGIFLGKYNKTYLPSRLVRHGLNFDFMISWADFDPNPNTAEMKTLIDIVDKEIEASRVMELLIFHNPKKHFALHKPLVLY